MPEVELEKYDVADEIAAMKATYDALLPLTAAGRQRVLNWAVAKLNQLRITQAAQAQAQQAQTQNQQAQQPPQIEVPVHHYDPDSEESPADPGEDQLG